MGDVGRETGEERPNPFDDFRLTADGDAKRARLRRGAGARHRRVDKGRPRRGEALAEGPRHGRRRRRAVGDDLPGGRVFEQTPRHLQDFGAAGKRQEDKVGAAGDLGERLRRLDAVVGKGVPRGGVHVPGEHRKAGFARQMAAHRRAHRAEADEAQAGDLATRCAHAAPSEANSAAA